MNLSLKHDLYHGRLRSSLQHGNYVSTLLRSPHLMIWRGYRIASTTQTRKSRLSKPRGRPIRFAIHTLDPELITCHDALDISNCTNPRIWDARRLHLYSERWLILWPNYSSTSSWERGKKICSHYPFPPDTRGFLYYSSPRHVPLAGAVRFRVTGSDDPSSLQSGSDLLYGGVPWQVPLLQAVSSRVRNRGVAAMLLRDGLILQSLLEHAAWLVDKDPIHSGSTLLHSFGQPFVVRLNMLAHHIHLVGQVTLYRASLQLFKDGRNGDFMTPYAGLAVCCFEHSALPEHKDTRTLVLRVLKMIEPVTMICPGYDGHIAEPREGELLYRNGHPWFHNVDNTNVDGSLAKFRLLFENENLRP